MKVSTLLAISALAHPCSVTSFVVPTTPLTTTHVTTSSSSSASTFGQTITTQLSMAGFGGGGGGGSKKNKKAVKTLPKLKAKTQWDRYADLKQCKKVIVGVKIVGDEEEDADWLEVGKVRSDNDEHTLVAIANQRALIADHAKRLYPVKVPANSVLEWGYFLEGEEEGDNSSWVTVDKASGADAPKGIEKKFGFEGISDKASGFYCYYSEGRVVERGETLASNLTTGSKTLPN
mmetsp:Transcript_24621/g.38225  ORF Transcript_24621/g.38225 Transcript_24621/m.38225 type:complete len:233 (+) Transcript_24621:46-744(+)